MNPVHGETPPSPEGGRILCWYHFDWARIQWKEKRIEKIWIQMNRPNFFCIFCISSPHLYTSPLMADWVAVSETCHSHFRCFEGVPLFPFLYMGGCSLPMCCDSAASNSAARGRLHCQLPIPLFHWVTVDLVQRMVDLWPAAQSGWEVTHGKYCESALLSASPVCKRFSQSFYTLYIVQCTNSRAFSQAWIYADCWSKHLHSIQP